MAVRNLSSKIYIVAMLTMMSIFKSWKRPRHDDVGFEVYDNGVPMVAKSRKRHFNFWLKSFAAACLVLSLFMNLFSCADRSEVILKQTIEAFDEMCPINLGMIGDLFGAKYDEKAMEVQMYYYVNEEFFDLDVLNDSGVQVLTKKAMLLSYTSDQMARQFVEQMIRANAGLRVTFKSISTGASSVMIFSVDELEKCLTNPMSEAESNQMLLEIWVARENAQCPNVIDYGMTEVGAFDDGNSIIICCSVDEEELDMSDIEDAQIEIKQNMKETFAAVYGYQLEVFRSVGRGCVFRYCGDTSGKTVDITFSVDELEDVLK